MQGRRLEYTMPISENHFAKERILSDHAYQSTQFSDIGKGDDIICLQEVDFLFPTTFKS